MVRGLLRPIGIALVAGALAAPAHERSLSANLPAAARAVGIEGGSAFDALANAIADTAARSLPVVAASAGYTYRYNPTLEAFERTSDTLGPIFLERPDTLGRGKLNVNVSYQYVDLNQIDGSTPITSRRRIRSSSARRTRAGTSCATRPTRCGTRFAW